MRLSIGFSVSDLAKKMRVSRQTIYNWEDGTSEPKLSQFIRLYILVGMNPANIIPQVNKTSKGKDDASNFNTGESTNTE